uniref:Hexosyltransferase n=1 Tax=Amazona collaria TaxID=241587 RepID=A0A8B9F314_9PSIT
MKWQLSLRLLALPALAALVALVGLRWRQSPEESITVAPSLPPAAFQWHRLPAPAGNATAPTRHPLQPPYPHPYRFLLNQPHKCRERAPFLVLLVATGSEDTGGRNCIRHTWGNESSVPGVSILRLFLLGLHPVFADALGPVLQEENAEHGDLLQQDFLDTYNNLTLKTLMGKWEWSFPWGHSVPNCLPFQTWVDRCSNHSRRNCSCTDPPLLGCFPTSRHGDLAPSIAPSLPPEEGRNGSSSNLHSQNPSQSPGMQRDP